MAHRNPMGPKKKKVVVVVAVVCGRPPYRTNTPDAERTVRGEPIRSGSIGRSFFFSFLLLLLLLLLLFSISDAIGGCVSRRQQSTMAEYE